HQINSSCSKDDIRRNWGRPIACKWPGAKQVFQFLDHLLSVKISADRHDEIRREKPSVMKSFDVRSRDALDRCRRRVTVCPEVFAQSQETVFAAFNRP